jgi:hypothetical protein
MSGTEQRTNPYEPSMQGGGRGLSSKSAIGMIFGACIVMVLFSLAVSGQAILKILKTTPFMGIQVDALGNRIPIQGYPQLGFGLASAIVFTTLALFSGMRVPWSKRFTLRTLLIVTTLVAAMLGLVVWLVG